jgi:hypothetical protein
MVICPLDPNRQVILRVKEARHFDEPSGKSSPMLALVLQKPPWKYVVGQYAWIKCRAVSVFCWSGMASSVLITVLSCVPLVSSPSGVQK